MADSISQRGPLDSLRIGEKLHDIPKYIRTLSQKVMTAVLRIFQLDPAHFYAPYKAEQTSLFLAFVHELDTLHREDFESPEALQQHVFARLAKNISYYDFEALTPEMRKSLTFQIPVGDKIYPYTYHETIHLAGFCECTILTAEGAPPIALIPGTYPGFDHPAKFFNTVGSNLQGTTWNPVADAILEELIPYLAKLSEVEEEPSFHMLGHSAGASALRLALSKSSSVSHEISDELYRGRLHAFSPPATSSRRAHKIDNLPEQQQKQLLTTYLEADDPIAHMGGTTHAGKIVIAPPRDQPTYFESHILAPKINRINNRVVTPYTKDYVEKWSLNMTLSKATIGIIAFVNTLGISALIGSVHPSLSSIVGVAVGLMKAVTRLSCAILMLSKNRLLKVGHALVCTLESSMRLAMTALLAPFLFLYTYWNQIIAPAVYSATGIDVYLKDYARMALNLWDSQAQRLLKEF